eukprot:CAMPEP_0170122726 /NCGR_PEP_ID=MMETSP0020_2-20130122/16921_1 /TAXON_ID=98059 /ORGANISM="Dinobryon sp., Strain UTEXLB2267" /LENGTH=409 /DNA_ID=CAMNT_0010353859 /DNA_START=307 /DNA_END=1536 /DNA_ORIENTATION=-
MASVAGFLGSTRWYYMGDASQFQAILSLIGFGALLLVAAFELDVVPERFLESKLSVTAYLIELLEMKNCFDFELKPNSEKFRDFIRKSKDIYYLYDEDKYIASARNRLTSGTKWKYFFIWEGVHMTGAVLYVVLVTAAILLNEIEEERVAWITGGFFVFFCFMGYLTGRYAPLLGFFKGWVMLWNPFLKEPNFLSKLRQAVFTYSNNMSPSKLIDPLQQSRRMIAFSELEFTTNSTKESSSSSSSFASPKRRLRRKNSSQSFITDELTSSPSSSFKATISHPHRSSIVGLSEEEVLRKSIFLRFAHKHPELYLKIVGHLLVMSELVALLTPAIAMGIQWVTALCGEFILLFPYCNGHFLCYCFLIMAAGPPITAILELLGLCYDCIAHGDCSFRPDKMQQCILKGGKHG